MSKNSIDIPKGFSPSEPVGDPAAQPNHQKSEQASIEAPTDTNAETSEPPAESSDFPPIPLPPIGSHPSKDACVKSVQQFGMQNGFAVASANQYLVQGQQQFVYQCDKAGKYRPHQKPKKAQDVDEEEEETNKTDEPNDAEGTAPTPGPNAAHNDKTKQWDLEIRNPNHNHPPSTHPGAHIIHRRFTESQGETISTLTSAGVPPLKIKNTMMKGDFTWALDQLRLALSPHVPQVILTDKEQALMNAIEFIFPTA
ncbi:hypothetical protein PSHT_10292 [Puccinia striiformis]|uniref:Uncharacterized protein n=3 Tax=Puccinia striiformis TaxID=27350 RepID=A0A2S4VAI4_9BASI|nr:hypothetical protein PSHT_10292 [Puccinia striiformis]POW10762.1 hypothetical protein PSTT_05791 [Puccinia striiformis]